MTYLNRSILIVQIALLIFGAGQVFASTQPPTIYDFVPTDGLDGDEFGASTSLFNDTLVVGAPGSDINGADSGAVYVFIRVELIAIRSPL